MIYFLQSGPYVKIGFTDRIEQRFGSLKTASPHECVLLGVIEGSKLDEEEIHGRFRSLHHRGEWFKLGPTLMQYIVGICGGPNMALDYADRQQSTTLDVSGAEQAEVTITTSEIWVHLLNEDRGTLCVFRLKGAKSIELVDRRVIHEEPDEDPVE